MSRCSSAAIVANGERATMMSAQVVNSFEMIR
jgi:hypothetical protein